MLITDLEVGGVPLHLKQLAAGLNKDQYDLYIASLAGEGPIANDVRKLNIQVACLSAKGPWDLRVFFSLARLIARYRPHILHAMMVHPNVVGRIVGLIMGVPNIIASIHTAEKEKKWHLQIENATCRLSRLTVCVSPSVYKHVQQYSRVPTDRLRTIPYGIDVPRFANAKPVDLTQLNLDPQKPTLIFAGRLHPVKGIDLLLDAFKDLIQDHDVQLMIVGDGPLRQSLERQTEKLGLIKYVRFTGMLKDVECYLKAADAMIMPSYWEGLPISAIEAMAAGTPVLASRTEGLIDLIEHNKTGLLFQTGNRIEIKNAISNILKNPSLGKTISKNAQNLISKYYSQSTMIDSYSQLYESLISK